MAVDISSLFSKKFNMDKFSQTLSIPQGETYEEMMQRVSRQLNRPIPTTPAVKHVFEPPVDTSNDMNPNDLFKSIGKPKPYTTFHKGFVQESADNVSSIGTKLGSGISEVMRGLSSVTDLQSRGLSNAVGLVANPIIQLFGGSKVDFNKSITQHAIGVAHDLGLKPIDTSTIKDANIKAMAEAVNQETNPTAAYWRRIGSAMDVTSAQLQPKIGAVAKFTGDIARSTPQMAAYAVSGGAAAIGQYANSVEDLYASDVKPTTKQVGEAIMQANIDVGTEMIFDLFGNINGLIKNSLKIQGTTAVGKALAPTAGIATLSALKAAGGEGVEELIAYPLQQITTWLYQNEDKPLSDYFKQQNINDWIYAGIVGASMGLIVGSYQAVKSPKVTVQERKEIETLATEMFNTPITKLTEAQATKLLEKIAEPLKAMSKAPTDIQAKDPIEVEKAQNSKEVLSHRLNNITKSKQDLIAQMTEEDDAETIADYNIKLQEISDTEAEVRQKLQTAKSYESITQKVNKSSNVGYHAGNLGKAEHLSNMTGGRGTGHFGTGTYFVGSKNIIDKSDTYASRPINEIDFDGYNLYKPKTKNEGVQLHEALKFINNKLQYDASNITSNDDISNYSDSVNDALSDWEETISESDPYGDKAKLNQLTSLLSRFYNEQSIEHELSRFDKPWQAYESLVKGIERKVSDTQYNREYFEEHIKNLSKLLGVDSLKIKSILDSAIKKYSPIIKDGVLGNKIDSISTLLMKELGYEGVDVRGLDGLDNFEFGSVIYDLKKETKPETVDSIIESELVNQSKEQNMKEALNFLPKSAREYVSDTPMTANDVSDWKKTISKETLNAISRSEKPNENPPIKDYIKEKLGKIREYVTLGSVPVDVSEGDIRRLFREARASGQSAKSEAENRISKSWNKAGRKGRELLRYAIIYMDIAEDIQEGLYRSGKSMMFDIKSPEEALKTIYAISAELNKPENALVKEAFEIRKKLNNEPRTELIAEARKAGINLEHIASRNNHMYHAITSYQEEYNAALKAQGTKKGSRSIRYLGRTGSLQDYISDPIVADFLSLQKMIKDTAKIKLYNEIKTKDISGTLKYKDVSDWEIPEGYSELDPSMIGIPNLNHYSKNTMLELARAKLESANVDMKSDTAKKALAKVSALANKNVIVVPTQIVDAVVNEFGHKETSVGKATKVVMNAWKYTKIRMPNAVIKYNIRNMMGDLDAVVAMKPSALLKVPKAINELFAYYYKKGALTADLAEYVKKSGMTTGQTPQELKTLKNSKMIDIYDKPTGVKEVSIAGVKKLWGALTMETATQFREQILRYAVYLSSVQEMAKSKNNLPSSYSASIPTEIKSIKDYKDRAFKIANDMVGAYDDVSILGQWAADHMMPFFRFKEVNVKRFYRMAKNVINMDDAFSGTDKKTATDKLKAYGQVGAFAVLRASKLLIGIAAFYGALALENALAGDDDDDLPEDVKNKPHVTIPRWLTGSDQVYYLDRLGSLMELMGVVGMDYSLFSDLDEISKGRMSLEDKLKEIATSPINDTFSSAFVFPKMAFELITGKTYFPDPKNPSQIRDTWEYLFGQVGLKDEYKAIAGKPITDGSYSIQKRDLLWNSVSEGDAAFYDVYDMVNEYYGSINKSTSRVGYTNTEGETYKRSQAAYYYKQALKLQDYNAAQKYLAEFVTYGGTQKKLNDTMKYLDPTASMTKEEKKGFLAYMTPEEKATYDKAMAYYKELYDLRATNLD